MRRSFAILFFSFVFLFTTRSHAASENFQTFLENAPCAEKVKAQVPAKLKKQTWTPRDVSEPKEPLHTGIGFRDTKTWKAYAIWVNDKQTNYLVTDLKTNKEVVTTWDNQKVCEKTETPRKAVLPPLPTATGFTDKDLQALLKKNKWGVIYIWTPYMPLSVDGLAEVRDLVKKNHAALTVLMDPTANPAEAQKWVDLKKATAADMKPVSSNELYARNFSNHYPDLFLYKDGFISNRTYEGHKKSQMYQKWIDLELAELKKDMK